MSIDFFNLSILKFDKGFHICMLAASCKSLTLPLSFAELIKPLYESTIKARGVGFEPTSSCEHGISNPTPYQARRPPLYHYFLAWVY